MKPGQRHKRISQRTRATQRRPRNRAAIVLRLGAIPAQRLATAIQPQCDARCDVCGKREHDEQGLGEQGLVVWACEEEVAVRFCDGAREERDERDVCDVEGCENCEGVGGVSLCSGYCLNVMLASAFHTVSCAVIALEVNIRHGGYGE
jgi:hypothetical protein